MYKYILASTSNAQMTEKISWGWEGSKGLAKLAEAWAPADPPVDPPAAMAYHP